MNFIDTNVIVYFGEANSTKFDRAAAVIRAGGVISVQVLNEFANTARRKNQLDWNRIGQSLEVIRNLLEVKPLTIAEHETALRLAAQHNFHFYDALIVASALLAGCDTLCSEDMHHGLVVENRLTIVNPFA